MSSFSFSHQFSQRWLAALPAVKNAIIQELDDIATLLHPDSDLSGYKFSVPNLNTHVEEVTNQENARLARIKAEQEEKQRLENERLEQERLAREQVEKERLDQERREQMRLENERLEKIRLEKEYLEQQRIAREKQEQEEALRLENEHQEFAHIEQAGSDQPDNDQKVTPETTPPTPVNNNSSQHTHNQPTQKTTAHFANMANPIHSSVVPYEKIKQEITTNLCQQMEEYIQESAQMMRNDLRPWLESEIEKQLSERLNQSDNPF